MSFPDFNRLPTKTNLLTHIRNGAAGLGFAALVTGVLQHKQVLAYFEGNIGVLDFFRFAVYFYVLLLGVLWYYTGSNELQLLHQWLKPIQYIPKRPVTHIIAVLAIGLFIGLMFSFVTDIWIFSTVYFLYLLFDIYTWRVRIDEIKMAIDGTRKAIEFVRVQEKVSREILEQANIYEAATHILENYYINRPHIYRIIVIALPMGVLAFLANLIRYIYIYRPHLRSVDLWMLITTNVSVDAMRGAFYTLFLLLMVSHEWLLSRWRREMEGGLNQLDARLLQLELDIQFKKLPESAK
jgi:hypothetical protein